MDERCARGLIELNNRFYAANAASFSATRSAPWEGWRRVEGELGRTGALETGRLKVLDLACGNLRFERFLAGLLPEGGLSATAIDSCPALGHAEEGVDFVELDILDALMGSGDAPRTPLAAACDLAVCFGFMHHVPGFALRARVVGELVRATRPGGLVAISFWQFMDDPRLARKAREADAGAGGDALWPGFSPSDLEPGDHFLGWQGDHGPLRYCHHFTEPEIDALARGAAGAREVTRFSADGSSHSLNRYLVLQRDPAKG
ncbi:MAG: class I SAM-dependent methyltransferase [Collinsella sp.]|nr:class I SAM-dependent methyltransferase [Collinsella sp.]